MPWRERAHPKIPSSSIFLCLGATHVDFKAVLCELSGPHPIGTLFPLSQREIIESEEGKKKGEERLEGELGSLTGILWKTGSASRLGLHPSQSWSRTGRLPPNRTLVWEGTGELWAGIPGVRWDLKAGKAGEVGNCAWGRLWVLIRA